MNVPVTEAKARFAELLRRAEAGEEVVITRHGKPLAKLSQAEKPGDAEIIAKRKAFMGSLAGKGYWIADDFDDPLPDFEEYM